MEQDIDKILENYFEGETTLEEEKLLRTYFCSADVAEKHKDFIPLFRYQIAEREVKSARQVQVPSRRNYWWAAATCLAMAVGLTVVLNRPAEDLGTYDNPEEAFRETQKALNLLSTNVNKGVESVEYLKEYEETRKTIFKN